MPARQSSVPAGSRARQSQRGLARFALRSPQRQIALTARLAQRRHSLRPAPQAEPSVFRRSRPQAGVKPRPGYWALVPAVAVSTAELPRGCCCLPLRRPGQEPRLGIPPSTSRPDWRPAAGRPPEWRRQPQGHFPVCDRSDAGAEPSAPCLPAGARPNRPEPRSPDGRQSTPLLAFQAARRPFPGTGCWRVSHWPNATRFVSLPRGARRAWTSGQRQPGRASDPRRQRPQWDVQPSGSRRELAVRRSGWLLGPPPALRRAGRRPMRTPGPWTSEAGLRAAS